MAAECIRVWCGLRGYIYHDSTHLIKDFETQHVRRRLVFDHQDETDREVENIFADQNNKDEVS